MPIVYVHGVNTRTRLSFEESIRNYLRRYVAPVISTDRADDVSIEQAYWGDLGVEFAFGGKSRPVSQLLAQGTGVASEISSFDRTTVASQLSHFAIPWASEDRPVSSGGLLSGSGGAVATSSGRPLSLGSFSDDELCDLLVAVIDQHVENKEERIRLSLVAEEVVHDLSFRSALQQADALTQATLLLTEIERRSSTSGAVLLAQGGGLSSWFVKARDRLSEMVRRAGSSPAYAASVVLAELRKPLNELISVFVGDVFKYLDKRVMNAQVDGQHQQLPGEIPQRLLDKLLEARKNQVQRGGEPLVVLSHSMGGQIVYDAITTFMREDPQFRDVRIDFWCATASQVGFFEEAKLFLASKPEHQTTNPVPFPTSHLGCWWNVWDSNDVLSFTTREIFQGVDDESYSSGMSLLSAHGGYLARPSFYRRFAQRLNEAKDRSWRARS